MADTPRNPLTPAGNDARFMHAAWETLRQSYDLLDQTKALVREVEGGSVIGARVFNLGEGDLSEDVKQHPDG